LYRLHGLLQFCHVLLRLQVSFLDGLVGAEQFFEGVSALGRQQS
jgi:hypothetical protein